MSEPQPIKAAAELDERFDIAAAEISARSKGLKASERSAQRFIGNRLEPLTEGRLLRKPLMPIANLQKPMTT